MKCPRLGRLLVRRCDCEQCATHRRRVHARSVASAYDALALSRSAYVARLVAERAREK